jgi:hypothetical protein
MEGEHEPVAELPAEPAASDSAVDAITPPPAASPAAAPPPPPPEPPPYVPPPQYGVPSAPPPPPAYAPPAYGTFSPAAPAARRGGSRTPMVAGIVAVFLILVLGGGAFIANASLSSTYSPQRAVTAYLAAQSRGDVATMMANANFLKGDNGLDQLFNQDAVTAMLGVAENRALSNVSVTSTESLDSSTSKVTVEMTWNGGGRTQTYVVHKDTARVHDLFYYSWRADIAASSVSVTLPNQAGAISVDGISLPSGTTSFSVIQGYHTVTMASTDLYDTFNQTVNAVEGNATLAVAGNFSADATSAAVSAVKDTFNGGTCDTKAYFDCPNHKYTTEAGYDYTILPMPGGDVRAVNWIFTLASDPTAGMKLVVATTAEQVNASGSCAMKLVVDGRTTYNYAGDWSAVLTFNNGAFDTDLTVNCDKARA